MRKWGTIAVGVFLALILAGAIALPLLSSRARRQIEARHEAIRSEGFPATLAELDAWYGKPPVTAENAAVYVDNATRHLRQTLNDWKPLPLLGEAPMPEPGAPFPAEQQSAIATALERNAEALPLYREAARLKQARYDVDLTLGYDSPSPHSFMVSLGADLLSLNAAVLAERGETDAAVDDLVAAAALGETLASEPTGMAQRERISIDLECVLPVLARLLSRARLSDAQLTRLSEALRDVESRDTFYRGIAGNRCMDEALFDNPEQALGFSAGRVPDYVKALVSGPYRALGLVEWDRLYDLERMNAYLAAVRAPMDERAARIDAVERTIAEPPRFALVSRYALSAEGAGFRLYMMNSVCHAARLRCARVALALERYRLAHGNLPERLDDLVPNCLEAVPRDPFAKEPVKYLRKDGGYIVYSIGIDRTDDGGRHKPIKRYTYVYDRNNDETFEVQRPTGSS